ncbi:hypothetical protein BH09DEP1_BH09DEP1_1620 [soil metagenome]
MKNNSFAFATLFIVSSIQQSVCMQSSHLLMPDFSVSNGSGQEVTGWLQRQHPLPNTDTFILGPMQTTQPNQITRHTDKVLGLLHAKDNVYQMRTTKKALKLCVLGKPELIECSNGACAYQARSFKLQSIPWASIPLLAVVLVRPNGTAALVVPGYKPNDERPDVPLAAYKALVGHEAYASPEYILGLEEPLDNQKIQPAYDAFVKRWERDFADTEHAAEVFKLVLWAKSTLTSQIKP